MSDVTIIDAASQGEQTACCVVGAGPAGAVLALMLARAGIAVTLLEEHHDFERDFRGDTLHAASLQIMDELGLIDKLLQRRHTKISAIDGPITLSLQRLHTKYPYVMIIPQADFLAFLIEEAKAYPSFRLVMGARVEALLQTDGAVQGVRYRTGNTTHELRAKLTVGADGRFSRTRKLAGLTPKKTSSPIDVLWFRLPRVSTDPEAVQMRVGQGSFLVLFNRFEYWQVGYVIPKDGYRNVRAAGLPALRETIAQTVPELADRVDTLAEWSDISVLAVESNCLQRWFLPGLLLIGDAAHTMSPIGGLGINYAIQDAVEAANVLAAPLLAEHVTLDDLAAVQRRREFPTRLIQRFQNIIQQQIIVPVLETQRPFKLPWAARVALRTPLLRNLPPWLVAIGVRSAHVRPVAGARRGTISQHVAD